MAAVFAACADERCLKHVPRAGDTWSSLRHLPPVAQSKSRSPSRNATGIAAVCSAPPCAPPKSEINVPFRPRVGLVDSWPWEQPRSDVVVLDPSQPRRDRSGGTPVQREHVFVSVSTGFVDFELPTQRCQLGLLLDPKR